MSDIFREIDEEVRRDKLATVWSRYGNYLIVLALAAVIGVAGWRFYEYRQLQAAQAVALQLDTALRNFREDKPDEGEQQLAAIAQSSSEGYRTIARFRLASEKAKTEPSVAVAQFEALQRDASIGSLLQDLARLRAAMIKADTSTYDEVKASLQPLASPTGIWRHTARELLGVSALKAGNFEEAGRWFDQLVTDRETPTALRQRGDLYLALVRGGAVTVKQ